MIIKLAATAFDRYVAHGVYSFADEKKKDTHHGKVMTVGAGIGAGAGIAGASLVHHNSKKDIIRAAKRYGSTMKNNAVKKGNIQVMQYSREGMQGVKKALKELPKKSLKGAAALAGIGALSAAGLGYLHNARLRAARAAKRGEKWPE